ncbi:hypothetical protein [Longitalea arenae]|uniref:hypothetical protein n=1 Tax=Longitalea arenae TaxID=2812558 RepID=UPI00196739A5|nr:hypothetical protein [Longitalea arenae]
MKRIVFVLALVCLEKTLHAQQPYIYTIKADSVKITNNCDTAELVIENHTQNVPGFLFNKGRGRTEFRRGLLKLTDSVYIVGGDTLRMNPWLQGGNRFGSTGVLGTLDNNHIDFYTNNSFRGRFTNTGNFHIGNIADNGDKLQVAGNGVVTISANLSRPSDRIEIGRAINTWDGQNILFRTSNDNGAKYKNIMIERDGHIGLGNSNVTFSSWWVGNPALRIASDGRVSIASNPFYFGNTGGPFNSSALVMLVSDTSEWREGAGNYISRKNHYWFGTVLNGAEGGNVRADLKISGRELHFISGVSEGEAMRVTESQNVVIGTTTDNGNRFQVMGNSTLAGDVAVGGNIAQAVNMTAFFGNGLLFNQESSRARIFSERGITYQSNSNSDQHRFQNSIGTAFTGTLVTIDPGYYQLLPDNQLALNVYGKQYTPGLAVNMVGRVGIGTQTPTAQLHTTGTVRLGGLSSNNSLTRFVVADANGNLYYREESGSSFNGSLNSDVAVNGRISAQKMLITQTGRWPDYVFNKDYKLPGLNEVEAFIKQNNHLPGIPSAAEVQKKGIDIGNNQAALLKKIEELTLYSIQQDKELQLLKQEMAELKALIKEKR